MPTCPRSSLSVLLVILCLSLRAIPSFGQVPEAPRQTMVVSDDVGRSVTLHQPVTRAVVFNGATTELIRTIVGMGVVVGVEANSVKERAYWPGVTDAMIVGQSQSTPNLEAIIALHPDVVFFPRNGDWQRAAAALEPFHIPVVVLTAWDLVRNDFNVDLIGRIFRQQERAAQLAAYCDDFRSLLKARLVGAPPKTLYLEQERPYTTVLKGSGWNDMIEFAGATNIFGDVDVRDRTTARGTNQVFEIDPEDILVRKPDLIVKLEPDSYQPPSTTIATTVLKGIAARPGFDRLDAVKERNVYYLSRLLTHACSKLIGSIQLAKWLYPDRFADIEPSEVANAWLARQGVAPVTPYWARLAP